MLTQWDSLPDLLRIPQVRCYYDRLAKHRVELQAKRGIDIAAALVLLTALLPLLCAVGVAVKLDDPKGTILYRQKRVTQNGRLFAICKFRTMRPNGGAGPLVTGQNDRRVTTVGKVLRRCKLDELPQLWNVLTGDMTLVGARPEVPQYVAAYTADMLATLLLPAGVTSSASLYFRNEEKLLPPDGKNANALYTKVILPAKMEHNLLYLERYTLWEDFSVLVQTAKNLLLGGSSSHSNG